MAFMARISNNMMYGQNMKRLSTLQAQLNKTQQHISANTRILTPADDPVGAARALDLKQGKSMNTQFASNRGNAQDALNMQESTLNSFVSRLQDVRTLLVAAGNGIYDEESLRVTAEEITAIRDELVGYANTRDAYGNYLFSGNKVAIEPFDMSVTGQVTYQGDDGQLMIQVDAARYMAATNSGSGIFMGIHGMSASTVEMTRNDLTIDVKTTNADDPDFGVHEYEVIFDGNSPASTYTLWRDGVQIDEDGNDVVPSDPTINYEYSGSTQNKMELEIDGVRFSISGEVSDGDSVKITTGEPVRTDVFAYINEAITLLNNTNLKSNDDGTNLALGLEALLGNVDSALDQIITAQSSTGTRLKELDALELSGQDKDLQYTESISDIEDLDYYEAISNLYMQQMTLEAAQKTFMMINGMSLFNMM
ncbi:flagellar hook-associated protein FlgL [Oxalobacter sp. OttesenSCG-928-P03]|nr:flagellar hook-associated protein FlgL [Oxalobacter sp. OttesenSCG-928-P03]